MVRRVSGYMKNKITPVNRERVMRDEDFIVSKTDAKGRIVYANRIFMAFAGYREDELLGKQHNIVRHPDMPRTVFHMMWSTLKAGNEFFGYVKNMASDGSYYWTFANVTPTRDPQGNTIGYFSVRRKPKTEAIAYLQPLYASMLAKERSAGAKSAIQTSQPLLDDLMRQKGANYDEFILSL